MPIIRVVNLGNTIEKLKDIGEKASMEFRGLKTTEINTMLLYVNDTQLKHPEVMNK